MTSPRLASIPSTPSSCSSSCSGRYPAHRSPKPTLTQQLSAIGSMSSNVANGSRMDQLPSPAVSAVSLAAAVAAAGVSSPAELAAAAAAAASADGSPPSLADSTTALQWALTLTSRIPFDEDGRMTSIGSIFHLQGGCKPCRFHHHPGKPEGCQYGVGCLFCHFHHERRRRRVANDRSAALSAAAAAVGRTPPSGSQLSPRTALGLSPASGSTSAMATPMLAHQHHRPIGGDGNNSSNGWLDNHHHHSLPPPQHHPAYPKQMHTPPPPPAGAPSYVMPPPGKHMAPQQRPPPPMEPSPPLPPPTAAAAASSSAQAMSAARRMTFSASSPALSQLPQSSTNTPFLSQSTASTPVHTHVRFPVGSAPPPHHIPPPPSAKPPPTPRCVPMAGGHYVPSPPHPLTTHMRLKSDSRLNQAAALDSASATVAFSHHSSPDSASPYGHSTSTSAGGSFGNGFYTPPARFGTPLSLNTGGSAPAAGLPRPAPHAAACGTPTPPSMVMRGGRGGQGITVAELCMSLQSPADNIASVAWRAPAAGQHGLSPREHFQQLQSASASAVAAAHQQLLAAEQQPVVQSKSACQLAPMATQSKAQCDSLAAAVAGGSAPLAAAADEVESLEGRLTSGGAGGAVRRPPLDDMLIRNMSCSSASEASPAVVRSSRPVGGAHNDDTDTPSTCFPSEESVHDDVSSAGDIPAMSLPPLSTTVAEAVLKSSADTAELLTELLSRLLSPTAAEAVLAQVPSLSRRSSVSADQHHPGGDPNGWDAKSLTASTPTWAPKSMFDDLCHEPRSSDCGYPSNPSSGAELSTMVGSDGGYRRYSSIFF